MTGPTEQDRKQLGRGWLIASIVLAVVFVGGFGACAFVASRLPTNIQVFGPRLKPIPVAPSSCPYLRRAHDTAEAAGKAWALVGGMPPSGTGLADPNAWLLYRALLRARFAEFERAMQNAEPHVPTEIAARLHEARAQVKVGLHNLPKVTTANDYSSRTLSAVVSGYVSLTQASELTGNSCGFTLAPDPSVAGWPLAAAFGETPTT
jgi:hypothetical protein